MRISTAKEQHDRADIILSLVSADFVASDYCYDVEMTHAMERHERGEACIIPVILRPCDWQHAPFGGLMAVPPDGKTPSSSTQPSTRVSSRLRGQSAKSRVQSLQPAPHRPPPTQRPRLTRPAFE